MKKLAALAALATCLGCGSDPGVRTTIKGTETVHNADATRIWVVQQNGDIANVVLCDVEMLKQQQTLCMRWPQR